MEEAFTSEQTWCCHEKSIIILYPCAGKGKGHIEIIAKNDRVLDV